MKEKNGWKSDLVMLHEAMYALLYISLVGRSQAAMKAIRGILDVAYEAYRAAGSSCSFDSWLKKQLALDYYTTCIERIKETSDYDFGGERGVSSLVDIIFPMLSTCKGGDFYELVLDEEVQDEDSDRHG